MKRGFNILLLFAFILVIFSCNKNKSYADWLKDQRKAIEQLMDENGFVLIKDYPANGVFAANEFYELSNGVYMNVIDSGNGNRAVAGNTTILCRFSVNVFMSAEFNNENISQGFPVEFIYGYNTARGNVDHLFNEYLGEGLTSPLAYVGDSSEVRLIVPFNASSEYFSNNYEPLYFDRVKYAFEP
ncbi:MAG: DUF4827 domain-containing protein [Tannerellaceae bacterium]|nr:DUF4827 domain-containing protein [Tannerellaceae bacterium]